MIDIQKIRELHQELAAARAADTLTSEQAKRIRKDAEQAANNDPRFLASFFHNIPPELLEVRDN